MPFTDIARVQTWWDAHGSGTPLLLLHPGGADSLAFDANLADLAAHHRVYRFDRRGHGRTPGEGGATGFEQMARDTIAFVEAEIREPAHLVGHSDGATVALLAARLRPDLVRGLVFSSSVFHHDGWLPEVPLDRVHEREPTLRPADLRRIATPTLLMFADEDEIAWEHVHALHEHLPHAQLAVVPGEDHGHPVGRPDLFAAMVLTFLEAC